MARKIPREELDAVFKAVSAILNLHALLPENLLTVPQACGRLRTMVVGVGGTDRHPLEAPQLIEECFTQVLEKASAIDDPFEQAFFALVHLSCLQLFENVNKRVSRWRPIPLIRGNLCPLSFVDAPGRADIDGIPVLVIECKNASKDEAIALGVDQLRRYHEKTPEVMAPQMLFMAAEAKKPAVLLMIDRIKLEDQMLRNLEAVDIHNVAHAGEFEYAQQHLCSD